jgi:hypothetical protein
MASESCQKRFHSEATEPGLIRVRLFSASNKSTRALENYFAAVVVAVAAAVGGAFLFSA